MPVKAGSITPRETYYDGYRFRSRLEARWAVFFDTAGIKYEYEPEGFGRGADSYMPDFYLPDPGTHQLSEGMWGPGEFTRTVPGIYVEVKPDRSGAADELVKAIQAVSSGAIERLLILSEVPEIVPSWLDGDGSLPHFPCLVHAGDTVVVRWFYFFDSRDEDFEKGTVDFYVRGNLRYSDETSVVRFGDDLLPSITDAKQMLHCIYDRNLPRRYKGTDNFSSNCLTFRAFAEARAHRFDHGEEKQEARQTAWDETVNRRSRQELDSIKELCSRLSRVHTQISPAQG